MGASLEENLGELESVVGNLQAVSPETIFLEWELLSLLGNLEEPPKQYSLDLRVPLRVEVEDRKLAKPEDETPLPIPQATATIIETELDSVSQQVEDTLPAAEEVLLFNGVAEILDGFWESPMNSDFQFSRIFKLRKGLRSLPERFLKYKDRQEELVLGCNEIIYSLLETLVCLEFSYEEALELMQSEDEKIYLDLNARIERDPIFYLQLFSQDSAILLQRFIDTSASYFPLFNTIIHGRCSVNNPDMLRGIDLIKATEHTALT